jgi:uncharacterized protein YjdB
MTTAYYPKDLAKIYDIPSPTTDVVVVGLITAGPVYGTVVGNALIDGDAHDMQALQGLQQPKINIVYRGGATGIKPTTLGSSGDVYDADVYEFLFWESYLALLNAQVLQQIIGTCPSPHLIVNVYIWRYGFNFDEQVLDALTVPVQRDGATVPFPTILCLARGAEESHPRLPLATMINMDRILAEHPEVTTCASVQQFAYNGNTVGTFVPYPASSPYCVSCGATVLDNGGRLAYTTLTSETCNFYSIGGKSALFSKPAWQRSVLPNPQDTQRGVPDVSLGTIEMWAQTDGVVSVHNSDAAALMAGFLACVNCRRFAAPLLYSGGLLPFHDITGGTPNANGYAPGSGWDYCTGLGSLKGRAVGRLLTIGYVPVHALDVTPKRLHMVVGQPPVALLALVSPDTATVTEVTWETSDGAVAAVDDAGVVTAVSPGTAFVVVTSLDGGHSAVATVTVVAPATGLSLLPAHAQLAVGATLQLKAEVRPLDADQEAVTWLASVPTVATVTSSGLVTARSVGNCVVQASAPPNLSASSTLQVVTPVTGVAVCPSELRLVVGASARLLAEVAPATAFNRNVWWTSDHTDVVRVDVSGRVTATALGSCLVTATSAAGEAHASCLVTVVVSTTDDLRCSC